MFGRAMVRGFTAAGFVVALFTVLAVSNVGRGDSLSFTTTGAGTVTIPVGYEWANVTVQCWGAGGGGGGGYGGGGGGGGTT